MYVGMIVNRINYGDVDVVNIGWCGKNYIVVGLLVSFGIRIWEENY